MVIYNLKDKQIIKINVNSFLCTEKKNKKKEKSQMGEYRTRNRSVLSSLTSDGELINSLLKITSFQKVKEKVK